MEFISLPAQKHLYSKEEVVGIVARKLRIEHGEADDRIANAQDILGFDAALVYDVLVGKSCIGGDIVCLKLSEKPPRRVEWSRTFKGGTVVAVRKKKSALTEDAVRAMSLKPKQLPDFLSRIFR